MKTLMTHFLTLCLIQMQLMIPVAMADGAGSGSGTSATDTVYASQGGNLDNGQVGGHGVIKPNQEKDGDEKAGYAKKQITLFALAASAPFFILTCKQRGDVWMFAGAALAYLAMEIGVFRAFKGKSDQEMAYYRDQDHDSQVQSLEAAANETQEAADAAKKKSAMAKMAATGMLMAAAIATWTTVADMMAEPAINPPGVCIVDNGNSTLDPFQAYALNKENTFKGSITDSKNSKDALANFVEFQHFSKGRVSSLSLDEYKELEESWSPGQEKMNLKTLLSDSFDVLSQIIMPKAQAKEKSDNSGLLAAGLGGVIGTVVATSTSLGASWMSGAKWSGWPRVAFYTVASGLTFAAAEDMADAGKQLGQRANQYRELAATAKHKLEQLDRYAVNYNEQALKKNAELNKRNGADETKNDACFTGNRGNVIPDYDCKCKTSNSCKKAEVPKMDFAQFDPNGILTTGSNLLGQGANALYAGNTAGAAVAGSQLGQHAIKIRNLKNKGQERANKFRKSKGQKPLDFDRLERSVANKIKRHGENIFNKLGSKERSILAGIAPPVLDKVEKEEKAKKANAKVAMKSGKALPTAKKDPFAGLDFEFEDSDAQADMDKLAEASKEGTAADINQYEVDSDDINEQRNANIFKLITTRYMQSAYPVLFEVKKLE